MIELARISFLLRNEFCGPLFVKTNDKMAAQICSLVVDYVDPSKLRYLTIPVTSVHDVEKLLKQFRELFRIRFDLNLHGLRTECGEIVK
jgi:hypothetical protein